MADNKQFEFIDIPQSTSLSFRNMLMNIVRNAFELYGDHQASNVKYIHSSLVEEKEGEWVVIMCPKDQKTYNIHFNCKIVNGENIFFQFTRENKLYIIFQTK